MTTHKNLFRTGVLLTSLLVGGVTVQAAAQDAADQSTTRDQDHRGFDNWGLLGLVGLAGLLGRKREREVTHTHTGSAVPNTGRM